MNFVEYGQFILIFCLNRIAILLTMFLYYEAILTVNLSLKLFKIFFFIHQYIMENKTVKKTSD